MKNFLKIVSVYVGAFFLAQRACVAYIWLLFKYAFICIPNTSGNSYFVGPVSSVDNSLVTKHNWPHGLLLFLNFCQMPKARGKFIFCKNITD